jgi:hypothetical protein
MQCSDIIQESILLTQNTKLSYHHIEIFTKDSQAPVKKLKLYHTPFGLAVMTHENIPCGPCASGQSVRLLIFVFMRVSKTACQFHHASVSVHTETSEST